MSSLWTDLLFLHGHIHDPELVRRLANTHSTPPPSLPGGNNQPNGSGLIDPDFSDKLIRQPSSFRTT